jgi:integrase/recombinase XerC
MADKFHIVDFVDYLCAQKRVSLHTVTAYENDLKDFTTYLEKEFKVEDIANVNHKIIRYWMAALLDSGIKARSVNRKISTLKTYYKFLLKNEIVTRNPTLKIINPKTEKKLPEFAGEKEMENLFDNIPFANNFEGLRNRLIITLFYTTGIRRAELIGLMLNDLDMYNMQIKVLGKGNKQRSIPVTRELIDLYKNYLSLRVEHKPTCNNVFITAKGKPIYERLVYIIVTKSLGSVTSQQKKSPHVLRHTFATHMLDNGADLNSIKEILGHANLSATQVYTHNSIEKLKKTFRQSHPRSGE